MTPNTPGADNVLKKQEDEERRIVMRNETIQMNRSIHEKLNEGLTGKQYCLREGITFDVEPNSLFGVEFFSWRSPQCTTEMSRFIEHAKGKKVFFDVGSYHGLFARVFQYLNPDGRTVAFEPMPYNWDLLIKNNKGQHVMAMDCALSDTIGEMEVIEYGGHYQRCSDGELIKKVQCVPGDEFIAYFGLPDLVKVDVEGSEVQVLKGMKQILESRPTVFLEVHCGMLNDDEKTQLVKLIEHYGYLIIDCETDLPIDGKEILDQKQGELRVILK